MLIHGLLNRLALKRCTSRIRHSYRCRASRKVDTIREDEWCRSCIVDTIPCIVLSLVVDVLNIESLEIVKLMFRSKD